MTFRPISMTKSELSLLYFPESAPHVAVNRLMRWIALCRPLTADLQATGYRKSQRFFSAQQVRCIVRHLGEP